MSKKSLELAPSSNEWEFSTLKKTVREYQAKRSYPEEWVTKAIDRLKELKGKRKHHSKEYVIIYQALLDNIGITPGKLDGIRGGKTNTAAKEFQKQNGVSQTGNFLSQTIAAYEARLGKTEISNEVDMELKEPIEVKPATSKKEFQENVRKQQKEIDKVVAPTIEDNPAFTNIDEAGNPMPESKQTRGNKTEKYTVQREGEILYVRLTEDQYNAGFRYVGEGQGKLINVYDDPEGVKYIDHINPDGSIRIERAPTFGKKLPKREPVKLGGEYIDPPFDFDKHLGWYGLNRYPWKDSGFYWPKENKNKRKPKGQVFELRRIDPKTKKVDSGMYNLIRKYGGDFLVYYPSGTSNVKVLDPRYVRGGMFDQENWISMKRSDAKKFLTDRDFRYKQVALNKARNKHKVKRNA